MKNLTVHAIATAVRQAHRAHLRGDADATKFLEQVAGRADDYDDDPRTDFAPYAVNAGTTPRRTDEFDADNMVVKAQTSLMVAADAHRRADRHEQARRLTAVVDGLAKSHVRTDAADHPIRRRSPYADAWRSTPAQIRADAVPDRITSSNAWRQALPSRRRP